MYVYVYIYTFTIDTYIYIHTYIHTYIFYVQLCTAIAGKHALDHLVVLSLNPTLPPALACFESQTSHKHC